MRRVLTALLLLLIGATACGGGSSKAAVQKEARAQVSSAVADAFKTPACGDVLKVGAPVTQKTIDSGCHDSSGTDVGFITYDCKDKRELVHADGGFYGFVGGTWSQDVSGQAGYDAASAKCL